MIDTIAIDMPFLKYRLFASVCMYARVCACVCENSNHCALLPIIVQKFTMRRIASNSRYLLKC